MIQRVLTCVLTSVLLLTALGAPAFAQGGRVELSGTVLDQGKAVLPGVTVTVTNQDTGLERQAVTTGEGRFVIPTLLPGTYTVKAELQGFETTTRRGLVLQVGQEVSVALTLNLAGVREEVNVTAESPVVETGAESPALRGEGRSKTAGGCR